MEIDNTIDVDVTMGGPVNYSVNGLGGPRGDKGEKGEKGDPGSGGGGEGDMSKSTYDPQNKRQDIFAYTDNTVATAIGVAADDLYNYLTEGL